MSDRVPARMSFVILAVRDAGADALLSSVRLAGVWAEDTSFDERGDLIVP